jgi:Lrp/AsnC family transcriptional regulator, leucine-responsive regulatory protein
MAKAIAYTDKKLDSYLLKRGSLEDYYPDEIDRRIIQYLSQNGRASYTEIADNMKLTPAAIRYRLTRLIDCGIIKNFKPLVDKKIYNLDISAQFMINLESTKYTEEVVNELRKLAEINQILIMSSNPNIHCIGFTQNMDLFSMLLAKITQIDGIKEVQTNFIVKSITTGAFIQ